MRNKAFKYIISMVLIALLGYNSMYFLKLDEMKASSSSKAFDATAFARSFYDKLLFSRADSAVNLGFLISLLETEPESAFNQFSNALAIGQIRYFLVEGEGTILNIGEDAVVVQLKSSTANHSVKIVTEFVYGNAIRDASGLLNLNDFANTGEFNSISTEVNKIIRKEVLPPFIAKAAQGQVIKFTGAIELHEKQFELNAIEILPIRLSIIE